MRPVVVSPTHGRTKLEILERDPVGEIAVIAGGKNYLNVPTKSIHVLQANLRRPPLTESFAVLFLHGPIRALRRALLELALFNDLSVRLIDHSITVHEGDFGDSVAVFGLHITFPQVRRFMHMSIGINNLHSL